MNILIVITSSGWGGLEMNLVKFAGLLKANGYDVHFAVEENTRIASELAAANESLLVLSKVKKYFDLSSARIIQKYLAKHAITKVMTTYRRDIDLVFWVKFFQPNIRVIHQQQMQIGISKKGLFQKFRYRSIDLWFTPLQVLKDEVVEKTVVPSSKIAVIPFGLDTDRFAHNPYTPEEAKAILSVPKTEMLWGIIGRIDSKKGQLFTVKALKMLLDLGEDVSLLIVGEPTIDNPESLAYFEELKEYIQQNRLEDRVFVRPFTTDTPAFYRAVDLFVLASESETYGLVTIEAMLSKTPVLATNSGGTPEVLNYGQYGELFDFQDYKSFQETYFELKNKRDLNLLNLESIQNKCIEKYSLHKEISAVLAVLNKL